MRNHDAATFGTALRQLLERLDGVLEKAYRDDGLDFRPRYTPIVRLLLEHGPMPIRDIAAAIGVTQPAISQTIAQMVTRGLVEPARGDDARFKMISLSKKCEDILPRLKVVWHAAADATANLDREVGGQLIDVVNRANHALAALPYSERLTAVRRGAAPTPEPRDDLPTTSGRRSDWGEETAPPELG